MGFTSWVNSVAFSTDGSLLAAGSSDRSVRVWDTRTWTLRNLVESPDAVTNVKFTRDGALLTTATDGAARLWDLDGQTDPGLDTVIWTIQFDRATHRLAAFGDTVGLWDTSDPLHPTVLTTSIAPSGEYTFSGAGAISPDGDWVVAGGGSGEFELLDVADPSAPRLIGVTNRDGGSLIEATVFRPDGRVLAVGGDDQTVRLYDLAVPSRPRLAADPITVEGKVIYLAFTPDGAVMATTGSDALVHVYDVRDIDHPVELAVLGGFESDTNGVAFSPDGTVLAAGSSDRRIILWDVSEPAHPRPLGGPITGPHGGVFFLSFSPDGERLAAAITDHSVWVWDVSEPAHPKLYADLESPISNMHGTAWSADGQVLVGAGSDTSLYFWTFDADVAAAAICRGTGDPITPQEWSDFVGTRDYDDPCS
jgi:WD40 repeat protein